MLIEGKKVMTGRVLFTDGSANPQMKIGVGAYLALPASILEISPLSINQSRLGKSLQLRRFSNTSSTKLEVQTVLWALEDMQQEMKDIEPGGLYIFSDSQAVNGLLKRRTALEANDFCGKKTQHLLKHAPLYRSFFHYYDQHPFEVIKVQGHTRSGSRDTVHKIFSVVDRAVRKSLKNWCAEIRTFSNSGFPSVGSTD